MTFDRRASARRIKPQRRAKAFAPRADADLPLLAVASPGRELLLDTCVYIDVLQGRTPAEVDGLLSLRTANHSTVALAELTHLLGVLDPAHHGTRSVLAPLEATLDDIPGHRLHTPSARAAGEAGMLAGLACRLAGRARNIHLLNDALLFLHAIELGCDLLSANVADFDLFDQLMPGSGVTLYRRA